MGASTQYLNLFSELTEHLEAELGRSDLRGQFVRLLDAACDSPKLRHARPYRRRLEIHAQSRNAIVHIAGRDSHPIAEPLPETFEELETLVTLIKCPPRLIPVFSRELRVFGADDRAADVLAYMKESDFSQVVIRDEVGHHVLSREGIALWLHARIDADGAVLADDTTAGAMLRFEPVGTSQFIARDKTVFDATEAFRALPSGEVGRLSVLIVTRTGRGSEAPLGLVTPWDLIRN